MQLVQRSTASPAGADPLLYTMSDESVDRFGDVVEAAGWDLTRFKSNPIALFGHDKSFIVGNWRDVRVEGKRLVGRLELMEAVSDRMREVHAAVKAGILRAVSVGFHPKVAEPIAVGKTGMRFKQSELVECSLVAVPANPNALAVARSLHISDDTLKLVFGKQADDDGLMRRGLHAGQGASTSLRKSHPMQTLSQRVQSAQSELVQLRDSLATHMAGDDPDTDVSDDLTLKIETKATQIEKWQRAEKAMAIQVTDSALATREGGVEHSGRAPWAMPVKKVAPHEYYLRAAAIQLLAHAQRKDIDTVRRAAYGDDEPTQHILNFVTKAASAPATTTTSGWASQLVQTVNADFMESLPKASIYPSLAARGLRLSFGRNGTISVPSRAATPALNGSFVGEGSPIPVRQGAFTSLPLTPMKMAVISTFTREIAQHSVPAIEGLIRDAILEDTATAIDAVLIDATVGTTIRPSGLRYNVAETTVSVAADPFDALVADIKALTGALVTLTNGNLRAPTWLMNPAQVLAGSLTQNDGGDFPFESELSRNTLRGFPVIVSGNVTAGLVILIDAADFVTVSEGPEFMVSDQATLHMEDTTPLAIGTAGAPATVAAPARSLFQTDSLGLRMVMPITWGMRRAAVAWMDGIAW